MPDFVPSPDGRALAAQLADACRRMAALDLPEHLAMRLHRQFIAICDAIKVADADMANGQRRLAAFEAALDRAAGSVASGGSVSTAGPEAGAGAFPESPEAADTTPLR